MSGYNPPLDDINFCIRHLADIDHILSLDAFAGMEAADLEQVLDEAGKFARDVIAPTNVIGDQQGVSIEGNTVRVPDEIAALHAQYVENGWQSVAGNPEFDGMGLPATVANAVSEMVETGNLAYSLLPMLTSVWEIDQAEQIVFRAMQELDADGLRYDPQIQIGGMIDAATSDDEKELLRRVRVYLAEHDWLPEPAEIEMKLGAWLGDIPAARRWSR